MINFNYKAWVFMGKSTSGDPCKCSAFGDHRAQDEPISSGSWLSFMQQLHCSVVGKGLTDGQRDVFSLMPPYTASCTVMIWTEQCVYI